MNETGKQHKAAWEYDAYNFWVEHSGTPKERAAEDKADPVRMLRKYAAYFDRYEGVRIANICGSFLLRIPFTCFHSPEAHNAAS